MQENLKNNLEKWDKIDVYSKWIYKQFQEYIGKRVLDIGIGVGNFETFFIDKTDIVVGLDIFQDQLDVVKKRFLEKQMELFLLNIEKDSLSPLMKYKFDTIICINVLEHLEDDLKALNEMKNLIVENGKIVIFVPAFNRLYNQMDKNVGHYRRYDKGMLNILADKAELSVIKQKHFNFFGIFPYYLKGKRVNSDEDRRSFSTDINEKNSAFINLSTKILSPIESIINIPYGLSEYIVLQK